MTEQMGGDVQDWLVEESIPASWSVSSGPYQRQVSVDGPEHARVTVEACSFDSFLISHTTLEVNDGASCICSGKGGTIGLYFNLAGSCQFVQPDHECRISAGEHTIYYTSDYQGAIEVIPDNGHVQVLEINIPVAYYERLFSGYSKLQNNFLERISMSIQDQIHPEMLPITMPMKWIINTIRQNRRKGVFKRLFLKAKILELLMLQVEQIETRVRELEERVAQPSEQEALYQAREILEKNLVQPPTIRHLARMVGMNEFSLKKGFKETFQETIYGFVNKLKMQQAKQILLEGNKSIHEVAQLAGYKNPQHFTAAFKKYFGVLPSKVR